MTGRAQPGQHTSAVTTTTQHLATVSTINNKPSPKPSRVNNELCPVNDRDALSVPFSHGYIRAMPSVNSSTHRFSNDNSDVPSWATPTCDEHSVFNTQKLSEIISGDQPIRMADRTEVRNIIGSKPLTMDGVHKDGLNPLPLRDDNKCYAELQSAPIGPPTHSEDPFQRQRLIITQAWPDVTDQARQQHPRFARDYQCIKSVAFPNFLGARIPVKSGLHIQNWRVALSDYHDKEILNYIEFGWPVGYHRLTPPANTYENHQSAKSHSADVDDFIATELRMGAILGPFVQPPFYPWMRTSPIMTRPKKD